ncbi:CPBP family intramembrane glutamic endopeptidase [Pedobacter insulae]|uniref:CAAX prenyl protease 2/Lysostaphin resistance protein A-like domain-containing protein n=1 Tax=Pedobacter insulae TaxID=414048 RepID=A0A1I2UQM9_9SPHI|nr:CPBP family intramembrane glutamic endopeptidase [Pedobacter insulae]SFG79434.1 hypothetical protein SAMN04489864_102292 [Pedobacter insulae]
MHKHLLHAVLPIAKLVLFLFCVLLFALPVGLIQQIPFVKGLPTEHSIVFLEFFLIFSVFGALFLLTKIFYPITFHDFFITKKGAFSGLLKGTVIGVIIMTICVMLMALTGNASFMMGSINIGLFFFYILYFLIVALFEELFFRTYALFVLAETYPLTVSVLINGVLFGLLHTGNAGFTWLAMLNISLAGILFSMVTLYHRNISWAIGIHLGWNFAQGVLFGFNVSGNKTTGLLNTKPIGPRHLSGGEFGIEGSVICTMVMMLIISYFFMKHKIEPIGI